VAGGAAEQKGGTYSAWHGILSASRIAKSKERDGPTGLAGCREMSNEVRLRDIEPNDLPIFYEQQLDADATRMAAFPARDRAAFDAHWAKILGNPAMVKQTILVDGQVAGNIGSWPQDGVRLVGYWIGKEHWGKGVATRALAAFLHLVTERPLHAHVAKHNVGSIRVLEKCGFSLEREESVEVAGKDVAELVLVLR
jgi:RimJ/RimL family protein N-acetyltransferase